MDDPVVLAEWGLSAVWSKFEDQEVDGGQVEDSSKVIAMPISLECREKNHSQER